MKRLVWTCLCGAAAMAATVASRATSPTVSPSEGGISRNFSIVNFGFVPVKKPVVTLVPHAMQTAKRRAAAKVLAFSGAQIDAQVITGVAGVYDVLVTPKDRGVAKVTMPDPFTILLPSAATADPASGPVNVPLAVLGSDFGEFKGKVTIGGKKAKVTRWMADRIEVVVPKKLKAGDQPIVVTNRAGASVDALAYSVSAGTSGGGTRLFKYDVGAFHFQTTEQDGFYFNSTHNVSQGFLGVGASAKPGGVPSMGFTINGPQLATPTPYDVTTSPTATGTLTATYASNGSVYQASFLNAFKVTITGYADGVIEGTFSGDMSKVAGAGDASITVTNGQFKALVQITGQ